MLLELSFDKTDSKSCGIYRQIKVFKQIRNSAYMVLVTVGDNKTLDFIPVFQNISKIGNDNINTRHFLVRKGHSAVHQEHITVILIKGDILAYFTETSERYYLNRFFGRISIVGSPCAARPSVLCARFIVCRCLSRCLRCGFLCAVCFLTGFCTRIVFGLIVLFCFVILSLYILFFLIFIHQINSLRILFYI